MRQRNMRSPRRHTESTAHRGTARRHLQTDLPTNTTSIARITCGWRAGSALQRSQHKQDGLQVHGLSQTMIGKKHRSGYALQSEDQEVVARPAALLAGAA